MSLPVIIDSFAGGGGTSEGIRAAIGRDPDYALNHDRLALAMHRINHPGTHHIEEDVWDVDAVALCRGRPVGLLWMSPDCKHFSKAKGGKPREKAIRGLAWVGVRWIKSLPKRQRPRVVIMENVEEFADWGPLLDDGRPCPLQRGATFRSFVKAFEALGYAVEYRELRACDYGAPTIRKRLFLVARRDGRPIVWPEPTHGAPTSEGVLSGRLKPWRTAAEIIDWSLPCPSIFDTSAEIKARYGIRANRPLADATMARIAKGTMRYVVNAARPFLVQVNHGGGAGGRDHAADEPMPTATGKRGEALVTPFVTYGQQAGGNHAAAVYAFLAKYYGEGLPSQSADEPLHTVTAKPRHGVVTVTVEGQPYAIVDIGMRMLTPRERFSAQGFRSDYVIDRGEIEDGSIVPLTLEQQGRMCGNSVCPPLAEALVRANYRDEAVRPRRTRAVEPMPLLAAE